MLDGTATVRRPAWLFGALSTHCPGHRLGSGDHNGHRAVEGVDVPSTEPEEFPTAKLAPRGEEYRNPHVLRHCVGQRLNLGYGSGGALGRLLDAGTLPLPGIPSHNLVGPSG